MLDVALWVSILISINAFVWVFFILFAVLRPLHRLNHAVKQLSVGELEKGLLSAEDIVVQGPEEVCEVARSCEEMKATLLQREVELSEINASLEAQNKKLQEFDIMKNQFLATISHELKTPLNAIGGFTELLHGEILGPINEKQKEKLERITERSRELLNLINQILEFNKIAAGKVALQSDRIFLADLGNELTATFEPLAARKGIVVSFDGMMKHVCIPGDYDKLKMVFNNLISNAIKFTENGSVTVGVEALKDDRCIIAVRDTGIGIPREEWAHVFDMFYQVDGSTTRKFGGSGLGLAIAKEIVELHNGRLWVESTVGVGTVFFCQLPHLKEVLV
jgi:signal transduction histidine kinase